MAQKPSIKQQAASKEEWNESRSARAAHFYTLGYSGRTVDEIVQTLRKHRVKTLVDIRHDPVSHFRPEMNKRNLQAVLSEHRISYVHLPQLGVPREVRSKAKDRNAIWRWYRTHVLAPFPNLPDFLNGFEPRVAFMCFELDPHDCHRHCLAVALEAAGHKTFDL